MSDEEQKRLEWFRRLNPPSFSGFELEDVQNFLDRCQQILRTAGILETSGWEAYELSSPVGAAPLTWHDFSNLFLEKFAPSTRKKELCRQFEQLCQEGVSMTQYEMRFSKLAYHTISLVPTERDSIRRFIDVHNYGLRFVMTREIASGARFDEVVDIAKRLEQVRSQECEERKEKRPPGLGSFSGVSFGG
ncbi:uncharacterized protein [Nicotiana tomentosiformis]|uniref:uncharacterized protein n=1 Tax=Nicotiana tomentosiformis TaxID=4098 RepID=UPI00388C34ED